MATIQNLDLSAFVAIVAVIAGIQRVIKVNLPYQIKNYSVHTPLIENATTMATKYFGKVLYALPPLGSWHIAIRVVVFVFVAVFNYIFEKD